MSHPSLIPATDGLTALRQPMDRRGMLKGAMLAPLALALPVGLSGCAATGGFSLVDAIRRLLTLSSQRALAQLMAPDGFLNSAVARIDLPAELGGAKATNILTTVLSSNMVRERLTKEVNRAAEKGADAAAPIIADSIRTVGIDDALAIVKGGPTAATDLLSRAMGDGLISHMFPAIGDALKLADNGLIADVLRQATGIDFAGLQRDVSEKANRAIFRAIGKEEAAIRADPQSTNDALLIGVFSAGKLL